MAGSSSLPKSSPRSMRSTSTGSARRARRCLPGLAPGRRSASRLSGRPDPASVSELSTLVAEPWGDYALLDSGGGRKLERYGRFRFIRPEPQAMWAPAAENWAADGEFIPGSDEEGG